MIYHFMVYFECFFFPFKNLLLSEKSKGCLSMYFYKIVMIIFKIWMIILFKISMIYCYYLIFYNNITKLSLFRKYITTSSLLLSSFTFLHELNSHKLQCCLCKNCEISYHCFYVNQFIPVSYQKLFRFFTWNLNT